MFVFQPIDVSASNLTSTVPEPDPSVGEIEWTAGTYAKGDRRIKVSTHSLYQSAIDNNTDDPEIGVDLSPPTWTRVSATNKYRMFDDVSGTQTKGTGSVIVDIVPNSVVSALACFNVKSVDDITVKVTDPNAGEVYNKSVNLRDYSTINDYYDYFFEDIINVSEFLLNDLPPYKNATIQVDFDSASPEIGVLAMGRQQDLGVAQYGSSFNLKDYSRKERDEFGNFKVVRRGTSKLVDFDVFCPTTRAQYVFERLAEKSSIPCVWYGTSEVTSDSTLVFGYYLNSLISISNPSTSDVTISIEGLV